MRLFLLLLLACTMKAVSAQTSTPEAARPKVDAVERRNYNEPYFSEVAKLKKQYSGEKRKEVKARILFDIGEECRKVHMLPQAVIWYTKCLKAKHPDPITHLHLFSIYTELQRLSEAGEQLKQYCLRVPERCAAACGGH